MRKLAFWFAPLLLLIGIAAAVARTNDFYGPGSPGFGIVGGIISNGGSNPPVGCTGTIDLSTGCPQPMLGVM